MFCLNMHTCTMYMPSVPRIKEKALDLLERELQLPCGFWEMSPSPLQERSVIIHRETSLQCLHLDF